MKDKFKWYRELLDQKLNELNIIPNKYYKLDNPIILKDNNNLREIKHFKIVKSLDCYQGSFNLITYEPYDKFILRIFPSINPNNIGFVTSRLYNIDYEFFFRILESRKISIYKEYYENRLKSLRSEIESIEKFINQV